MSDELHNEEATKNTDGQIYIHVVNTPLEPELLEWLEKFAKNVKAVMETLNDKTEILKYQLEEARRKTHRNRILIAMLTAALLLLLFRLK